MGTESDVVPSIPIPASPRTNPPAPPAALKASQPTAGLMQPLSDPAGQDSSLYDSSGGFASDDQTRDPSRDQGLWGIMVVSSFAVLILSCRICDCVDSDCAVWGDTNGVTSCSGTVVLLIVCSLLSIALSTASVFQSKLRITQHRWMLTASLWLIWTVGTFVSTFDRPWRVTGNGYYIAWICWGLSTKLFLDAFPAILSAATMISGHDTGHTAAVNAVIFGASLCELIAACYECGEQAGSGCTDDPAYAVAVGVIALLLSAFNRFVPRYLLPVAGLQLLWWLPAAIVLTFKGPFLTSGNGYFATWVATMASIHLLSEVAGSGFGPHESDSKIGDYATDYVSDSFGNSDDYRPPPASAARSDLTNPVPASNYGFGDRV
eukprot:TRINITY_DN1848_c0_g1_i1.p1 TRINITY_DN1848_c0_g1~~TRINITY_DN1848_c0_g1_i1.p1  ORF type:complete len:377 (-),score=65.38 TRINITY_DN1848_c0_g1_i1:107-1237(-)